MFSLGTIKIQTSVYGGLTIIRDDEELHSRMRSIQESYPAYTPAMLRKRALTLMALYYFINTGRGNKAFLYAAKLSGKEREEFYVSLSRGFKPGEAFITRFRLNPCAALLSFIHHRLVTFDYKEFDESMRKYFVSLFVTNYYSMLLTPSPKLVSWFQATRLEKEASGKF